MNDNLEQLIQKAEDTLKGSITVERQEDGWNAYKCGPMNEDLTRATYDRLTAKLKEWATPPKPEFLMLKFMVPTNHCEEIVGTTDKYGFCRIGVGTPIYLALVEALAPFQMKGN